MTTGDLLPPGEQGVSAVLAAAAFEAAYGARATVVGRAPGRVNLIGEHTDYNAGLVLPVALPHATYAAVALRSDGVLRVASTQMADPWQGRVDVLGPGSVEGWPAYVAGVVWAFAQSGHDVPGLDVLVDSTVPIGAGLSSSAALEASVAVALARLLGLTLSDEVRRHLIALCVRAETEVAGAPTGGMDQTIALLAVPDTALLIDFADDTVVPVPLPLAGAGLTLLVTDTRVSHALVDGGYGSRRDDCGAAARVLGVPTLREADLERVESLTNDRLRRRARHVVTEIDRVRDVVDLLAEDDWEGVGRLFALSHASMRDDFEISCPELDLAVETAMTAGAAGSRMTGGGFGGSCVSLVPRTAVAAVCEAIDEAFSRRGFAAPGHLIAEPSGRADVVDVDRGPSD
ncbi:galactokinase [Nocardioides sp.]|uniref:galactokinase n=1 Tax=Nocardioides sp. TaxID=35761 RepID=UPI00273666BD|nr:galactokinase [Nocardioides sp.]MDP3890748.1 galactokinase [Nocardioides sp.]